MNENGRSSWVGWYIVVLGQEFNNIFKAGTMYLVVSCAPKNHELLVFQVFVWVQLCVGAETPLQLCSFLVNESIKPAVPRANALNLFFPEQALSLNSVVLNLRVRFANYFRTHVHNTPRVLVGRFRKKQNVPRNHQIKIQLQQLCKIWIQPV